MARSLALPSLLAFALAATGCTWGGGNGPTLLAVTPSEALNGSDVVLQLQGRGFEPGGKVDFDEDAHSGGGWGAALVSGGTRIPLAAVTRISGDEARATLAAGAPAGIYGVEVSDEYGRAAVLPQALRVFEEVVVTTAVDEADAGATPANPMGAGLSLREAIAWVNATGTLAQIVITAPMTITMTVQPASIALGAPGARVVGVPGVVLDFGGLNPNCITLDGPDQRLSGVTLRGCNLTYVEMSASSGGSQVSLVHVDVTGTKRYGAWGILASSTSAAWSRIGPGNDLSGLAAGAYVKGANYEIVGNRFDDNGTGVALKGTVARVWGNTFAHHFNDTSNKGVGVSVGTTVQAEVLQNTFHANGGSALDANVAVSLSVRNNLFTNNAGFGVSAPVLAQIDHNGFFGNAAGDLAPPLATDPATDLLTDPLYVDAALGDLRLQASSPAIDKGIDTGLDVNGSEPGLFHGSAPDLGAFESP